MIQLFGTRLSPAVPVTALITVVEPPTTQLPRVRFSNSNPAIINWTVLEELLRHEKILWGSKAIPARSFTMNRSERTEQRPSSPSSSAHGGSRVTESLLARLVPKLVKHSSNPRALRHPYILFEPSMGIPLSTLSTYLCRSEQRLIDRQVGSMVRNLALRISTSQRFGPAARVCDSPFANGAAGHSSTSRGSTSWVAAFTSLMEGILRDGEDMSVLLPYEEIRMHMSRLSWRLSAVTVPRLLVVNAGDETNVMIQRDGEGSSSGIESIKITGLRDWSQGVFGDPLLCICFENPSEGFLEGWRQDGTDDIIEDSEGGKSRLLLYNCYRAVVLIVTQYYRRQTDSSRQELDGRKKLTAALVELEKVDIGPRDISKRGRSGSIFGVCGKPGKRLRLESEHS